MVEGEAFLEIEHREAGEDEQRHHLLDRLQLRRGIDGRPEPVGRHGEAILKEGDAPTGDDDEPQRLARELQVPIPGERHEDIGGDEHGDRQQRGRCHGSDVPKEERMRGRSGAGAG